MLALISQEADTTPAAVVSLTAARPELFPTVQTPAAPAPALVQAPVQAAVLPAVDLPL